MTVTDQSFWQDRWENGQTGWDVGYASPALIEYMKQYPDKNAKILIPGCGNAYEAAALLDLGFTNLHLLDIAPFAVDILKNKFQHVSEINIWNGDFFKHDEVYDLIIEQTFFCALDPSLRTDYVNACFKLLKPGAKVIGLLFNVIFEKDGPPFGGTISEYQNLFSSTFEIQKMEPCYNSIPPRAGNELFFVVVKPCQ
ncbi:MAG TPA: methyltransferase domain-containing protein [Saprospiraceae bacterium]|nr:methyltransferase domain-containing protein [Saprospiraceae bacterium]